MFIKKFFKKPAILIIYTLLVILGFYSIFNINRNIESYVKEYENIYINTDIKCEILSPIAIGDGYILPFDTLNKLFNFKEITDIYTQTYANVELNLSYEIGDDDIYLYENKMIYRDEHKSNMKITVYATNNLSEFVSLNNLKILKGSLDKQNDKNFAYISSHLADEYNFLVGDIIGIFKKNSDFTSQSKEILDLDIKSILDFRNSKLGRHSIILHNNIFFNDEYFLYLDKFNKNSKIYNKFKFKINPKYNNEFESIKEKIEDVIKNDYILHSTSREFYNVIKPLEEKILLQRKILFVLKGSLILITSFICFLLIKKEKREILIRLIHGEKKYIIFISELLNIIFIIFLIQLFIYLILNIFINISVFLLVEFLSINILFLFISLVLILKDNILKLYQDWGD